MNKKQLENRVEYLTVVVIGLVTLLAMNYIGDYTYRGANNDIIDTNNQNWITIADVLNNQLEINANQTQINEQNNEDITDNIRAIDKLLGILIRGEF